jgi:hypothetical protein
VLTILWLLVVVGVGLLLVVAEVLAVLELEQRQPFLLTLITLLL